MSPPDLNAKASVHVRHAISEVRATKTSLSRARGWVPAGFEDDELLLEIQKLYQVEKSLRALAQKLESTERYAKPREDSTAEVVRVRVRETAERPSRAEVAHVAAEALAP